MPTFSLGRERVLRLMPLSLRPYFVWSLQIGCIRLLLRHGTQRFRFREGVKKLEELPGKAELEFHNLKLEAASHRLLLIFRNCGSTRLIALTEAVVAIEFLQGRADQAPAVHTLVA